MARVLAIYRAERFSPNSVERDRAIMDAAARLLVARGHDVSVVREDELTADQPADLILTMGREKRSLYLLRGYEERGVTVINTPGGVEACARVTIDGIMRREGIPAAPLYGDNGYWIKRGDEAAQSKDDVTFAANENERDERVAAMRAKGMESIVVTAHVEGDLVKFYGVLNADFFRAFYPSDDGFSKFGDELVNGPSRHYDFSTDDLRRDAERLAAMTGTTIYGGDCVVREDGSYAIIDFNDWPSFSRCLDEAAKAIATVAEIAIK